MTAAVVLASGACCMAALSLLLGLRQLRINRGLETRLTEIEERISAKENLAAPVLRTFSAQLSSVEQAQANIQARPAAQTEKYRYAVALAAQGHTAAGIADALQMAPAEVEQVMRLAQVKRPRQGETEAAL